MSDDLRTHTTVSTRRQRITVVREDVLPPHSLEAERSVLGAMLVSDKAALWGAEHLMPVDFYREAHVEMFKAMQHLVDHKVVVDVVTLHDYFRTRNMVDVVGGPVYIAGLGDGVPKGTNIEYYAGILQNDRMRRDALRVADTIVAHVQAGELRGPSLLDEAEGWLLQVPRPDRDDDLIPARKRVQALFADLQARIEHVGKLPGLTTGIDGLDDLLGGLKPGDITIIAARPSIGKTALAGHIARAAAHHWQLLGESKTVGFFSLEMAREQVEYRLVSAESGVMVYRILNAKVLKDWEQTSVAEGIARYGELRIAIDASSDLTVEVLRSKARRLKADEGLGLIIVDYVQLMAGSGVIKADKGNRNAEIAHASRQLKKLAKELQVPIVVLSQLRRAKEGKEDEVPQLSDLRESGALEQDADIVVFIHRLQKYMMVGKHPAELIVAKQRNGPTGRVDVFFEREVMRFRDLTDEDKQSVDQELEESPAPVKPPKRPKAPRPASMYD